MRSSKPACPLLTKSYHLSHDTIKKIVYSNLWMTTIDHKKFKYFIMGGDPGVVMQSSYYPEWKAKAHVLANGDSGAGFIASQIDEVLFGSS